MLSFRRRALSAGVARAKALRPTASAGVGETVVIQRCRPSHGDRERAQSRRSVTFAAAASAPPPASGVRGARGVERTALALAP